MKTMTIRIAAWLSLALSWRILAAPPSDRTDWFQSARYDVFMHFLPADPIGLSRVKDFDVEALTGQLEPMGAKYFVLTIGQNSGYFNSPVEPQLNMASLSSCMTPACGSPKRFVGIPSER